VRIVGVYVLLVLILLVYTAHISLDLYDRFAGTSGTGARQQVQELLPEKKATLPAETLQRNSRIEASHKLQGVDISHWDGAIDWAALKKSDITFLYIKATQGTTYQDPMFVKNWANAKKYGFTRGAYHFFDPDEDGAKQAKLFLDRIKHEDGDLVPALDIEVASKGGPEKLVEEMDEWLLYVEKALNKKPVIYCDVPFWNSNVKVDRSDYPLWLAEWEDYQKPNSLPMGWKTYTLWQYSAKGVVRGINYPHVDLDAFKGSEQDLEKIKL